MLVVVCWFSSFRFSCWYSSHLLYFPPELFSTDLFPHSTAGAVTGNNALFTEKLSKYRKSVKIRLKNRNNDTEKLSKHV